MKRIFSFLLLMTITLSLVACGNKVENLIKDISTLEGKELTLADEKQVDKMYDKYLSLTEEEKAQITNYEILEAASRRVNWLSRSDETMKSAPEMVEEYIKSRLKLPSAMKVIKTEVYASKGSMFEAFVRMQYTGENAYGGKVEETCFAQVEMPGADYNRVVESHFGDAHETWEDLGWSESVVEEIDFETKYVP